MFKMKTQTLERIALWLGIIGIVGIAMNFNPTTLDQVAALRFSIGFAIIAIILEIVSWVRKRNEKKPRAEN